MAKKLRTLLEQTVNDPEFKEFMENAGVSYALMKDPAAFQNYVEEDTVETRKLMKELDIID